MLQFPGSLDRAALAVYLLRHQAPRRAVALPLVSVVTCLGACTLVLATVISGIWA